MEWQGVQTRQTASAEGLFLYVYRAAGSAVWSWTITESGAGNCEFLAKGSALSMVRAKRACESSAMGLRGRSRS